ncbi:MAG TPA: right-handed parallel beta-helix repeat-containing protein, partial [Longimicrobiales bacterium]|nr:right-handed parallel beta-helix repeat-containing protein [Longimicrobiales bacterium]
MILPRSRRCMIVFAFAFAIAFVACDDDQIGPEPLPADPCGEPGGVVHAENVGDEVWRAADNPHRVARTLNVTGPLTIESGVLVCAAADAAIIITSYGATIDARGTPAAPIVFTALDADQPWAGIHAVAQCANAPCASSVGVISNARVEHARHGIVTGAFTRIDSVHFRQILCTAARVEHIARSRVDSAGLEGCAAVEIGLGASRGTSDTFEDVTIVGSGGDGLSIRTFGSTTGDPPAGTVSILGGRIEGSAGVGLRFARQFRGANVLDARPVSVSGSGAEAVWAPLGAVAKIWPGVRAQEELRGTVSDTAVIWGRPENPGTITLGSSVVWQTRSTFLREDVSWDAETELRLEPGAHLDLRDDIRATGGFVARGAPIAPVTITGAGAIILECEPAGTSCDQRSHLRHTRLEGVQLTSHQHIVLDTVQAVRSRLEIGGAASRVTDIIVEDALGPAFILLSDVRVTDCTVRNNAFYGIIARASSAGASISGCVFESNRNAGVWNVAAEPLDARFNWWGDPAGPLGPGGDGVQGNVV